MSTDIRHTRLSGLEPLVITPDLLFINVGERTNVTGSAQFKKLIKEERYEEAVEVARQQVANGAQILDVNMDEGLIDSEKAMARFLNLIMSEPDIARIPVMVPEIITGKRQPRASNTSSTAYSAALALSVSKMVSTMMVSAPPSIRPSMASR